MPTARDALLDAAYTALSGRAWAAVRMVDVAAAAGVSRQTLYNEFGSKDGLARALVRRETDAYLAGVERALGSARSPVDRLAAAAEWTVRAARVNPLVHAALTGCWGPRLPGPGTGPVRSRSSIPAQRRADAGLPSPAELLLQVRDRAVAATVNGAAPREVAAQYARTCETAVRLALSCVLAPAPPAGADEGAARLVREALTRTRVF
ncbi:TetR/AcrR family transcriptional regulator [Streptomyces sp. GC420]|uniref:TetR/AcrR family transcriptional regulator n=1 Tax=Streptomyces sp. GC420 TaxID=2697568 RepID=UPI001414F259|nr:TetR/AcrR family transcriptional regulator [Streptomyces sp. GC420]NBM15356.1 TetR family transcriptional regulator [Streptomyces sp. GC420]